MCMYIYIYVYIPPSFVLENKVGHDIVHYSLLIALIILLIFYINSFTVEHLYCSTITGHSVRNGTSAF